MAVTKVLCLKETYQDCSKFTISDESVYGTVSPDRRQDIANILVASKMDEDQQLTYITGLDNSAPLSQLDWTIASKGDGAYRFFLVGIPLYDGEATYVNEIKNSDGVITRYANIIYHVSDQKYYKAIGTSFNGIEPGVTSGWETSWVEYDIITNAVINLTNDKLSVLIHDDISDCKYSLCLVSKIDALLDKELCGVCDDSEALMQVQKMQFLLDAAQSNNWQDKAVRSEVILKYANKKYCGC